ncbi:DUF3427 domain-containing protein [Myroides fluvii]|uniref:DUF3427 domain-containing protein n=1 Tax=Myroides fluvii TaxID=2572594 RepID=UPI00131CF92B|nr:DEAD/DEAH box helicase [Myroides fluvii]
MSESLHHDFIGGIHQGFIDKDIVSNSINIPKLLTNKDIPKEKVLSTLLHELNTCNEFLISVAFVTTSGIAVLFNTLIALEKRNIKGKVLVSQYLNFTQPEALKKLKTFKNIELKISTQNNTHTKGYIFRKDTHYTIVIGSSNLTANALTVNKEWNLKISGLNASGIVDDVLNEFHRDFEEAISVTDKFITFYEELYLKLKEKRQIESKEINSEIVIQPNKMQKVALGNLRKLRQANKNKGLIISATGTGKTYLSAFDVKSVNPKRMLFVVHRLNIANDALHTFKTLLGKDRTYGLFSGDQRDMEADFIFSTIQTISKEENLVKFDKTHFDYIIVDESHRLGGASYLRLLDYFDPKFLLGMTATPERTDGFDIFSLFDHNIAYEIRLHTAMQENMLSNFHYYGISDLLVNNEHRENVRDFNLLADTERVNKIIFNAKRFGSDNGIIRGLVFCSSNVESAFLSSKFNESGFKTLALSGKSTENERIEAIARLESDDNKEKLDYIFTVDIFNEGIDIPKINQILMIRPTESAIVFVQQLGRGLRKAENKEFLTIVDFIGNYENNYLIPIALYGDTSYNKDTLRRLISEGSKHLPGASTINFDEITKEKIYEAIATANMSTLSDLKKDYQLLKFRLGRIPLMVDFLAYESRDPFQFVVYSKSYYNFVVRVDDTFEPELDESSIDLLMLFSREINNAKRVEESYLLKILLEQKKVTIQFLKERIYTVFNYIPTDATIDSCIRNINFDFLKESKKIIVQNQDHIQFHPEFNEILEKGVFKNFFVDTIEYSIQAFGKSFTPINFRDGLVLYNKYSRKDVCRLLNWPTDISSTLYGYRTVNEITPCFVTYHKSDDIEETIKYNDHFISPSIFAWDSRSNRKLDSPEIKNVLNSKRILLFVKKEDAEGTDFYYMGDVSIIKDSVQQSYMTDSASPVVHFKFQLEQPVAEELYEYITSGAIIVD